jgi:hypothetical protein
VERQCDPIFVPADWQGEMPNGDRIEPSSTFINASGPG